MAFLATPTLRQFAQRRVPCHAHDVFRGLFTSVMNTGGVDGRGQRSATCRQPAPVAVAPSQSASLELEAVCWLLPPDARLANVNLFYIFIYLHLD